MARCLAVAINHAPGLFGTPDVGHCSSAATSASCASSSARPTSRTIRVRPAISLADSIRQTASIVRWVSVAVTATDYTIFTRANARTNKQPSSGAPGLAPGVLVHLLADALFRLSELGGERVAEILRLEHLADFDLRLSARHGIGAALDPFDAFFKRLHLEEPVAGDQLLGLSEWPVDDRPLGARESDPRALRAGLKALSREQHPGFDQLFVVSGHLGQERLVRKDASLGILAGLDQNHES